VPVRLDLASVDATPSPRRRIRSGWLIRIRSAPPSC